MQVRVKAQVAGALQRTGARVRRAQQATAKAVLRDCAPYVPRSTGALWRSGQVTRTGVRWAAPYARAVYQSTGATFSRAHHDKAGPAWFARAKADHLAAWVREAEAVVREG